MAISIGTIANLNGVFYVKDVNGDERVLRVGDEIFDGDVVSGALQNSPTSKIDVLLNNSAVMSLTQNQSQLFDISMLENTFGSEESAFNAQSNMPLFAQGEQKPEDILEEATAAGDESVLEEETAAGEEGGEPTSTDSGVFNFAQRDGNIVDVTSDLRDATFVSNQPTTTEESVYIEPVVATTTPAYGTLTLSDVTVLEGTSSATITASVNNAPQTDLNIVLSNGATVTILAGQTSGVSSPFAIQGDDPYVDNESYTVFVSSTTGGNYESLDTSDTATVTISDTIDTTTVSLSVEPSTVASGDSVTVTATVTNTPQTNLTVNLVDENDNPLGTITILAGQTSGQTTITLSDDTTISIDSHTGGNYENLSYGSNVGVVVPDAPIILSVDTHTLDEQHLYDGTQPDASQTVKIGSFVIVAEGGIASLQVGDENLSYDDLLNLSTTPVTVESENGNILTLTDFNSSTGEITYIYNLNNAVEHENASGENTLLEEFEIVLTDELSQTDEATLNINIIDDVPVLDITSGIIANTAGAELNGTLASIGADSDGTLTWTGVTANITTSEGTQSNVTLTSLGEDVNITYSGNVIAGTTADGDIVFTIIGNDDGTYTVNQYRTLDSSKLFETDGILLSYGDGKQDSYVLYEGTGNNLVADLTPDTSKEWLAHFTATDSGGNAKINMSGNGIGVENNLLESSEKISIDLNDAKQFSSIKVSVNQQYDYGEGQYIAYYTDGTDSGLQTITVGTNGDFFIQSSDDAYLDKVEIIGVDNQFKIDGMNFYVVDDDRVPSLDLDFTAVDSDGDDVSGSLSVTFDSTLDAIEGTDENDALGGSDADEVLYGDDGDDILNGGEGEDELYGQDGDDELVYDDADSVIDGGEGFDTLKLLDGQGIDFEDLGTQQIRNIEEIDLSEDEGSSVLENLTLEAVQNLTDSNNQLIITGDDTDQVTFKNTGTNEWSKVAGVGDELGFDIYTNSGDDTVRVLVEEEVVDEIN
jgi:hypothetical protein